MADRMSSKEITERDDQSGDSVDLIEITGVIKWFDVAKGFGFIVPDNGMQDVLLHVTCLRRDGYQTVLEGTRVVALIQKRDRGYQAFRILSMDQTTAIHPSQMPPVKTHVQVTPTSGLERVLVKWFNRTKGFGFLTRRCPATGPIDMGRLFSVCLNVRSALVALFLVLLLPAALQASETFEREPLTIVAKGGKTHAFTVELAVTPNQRSQGLMNRREMADDHGMLFAFGETRQVLMWMKNTYLPLDMLFIGKDGKIRTIKENAEPLSEAIIDSKVSVDFVLELNGGTVEKLGIKPGHRVESALIERMRTAN